MSCVTSITVVTCCFDRSGILSELGFVPVHDYATGRKAMQTHVFVGAFNYMDPQVLTRLKEHPWERDVVIVVRGEHDDGPTAHHVPGRGFGPSEWVVRGDGVDIDLSGWI